MPFEAIDVFHELVVSAFVLFKKGSNQSTTNSNYIIIHLNHASGKPRKSGFPGKQTF